MVDTPGAPPEPEEQLGVEQAAAAGVPAAGAATAETAGAAAKGGFFASKRNRLIVIAAAVVALLLVLGIVAVLVVTTVLLPGMRGDGTQPPAGGTVAPPSGAATGPAPPVEVSKDIPPSFEVFTENRDPFKPLVVPVEAGAAAGGGAAATVPGEETTTTTSATTETIQPGENVLYLADIETDDADVRHAIVYWDNERFDVIEGDQIGTSPWKVISIGTSSATFLFGDETVTLRVGEQLGK
jgi:hypothetical protein